MNYYNISHMLKHVAAKAGVKKRVHAHVFRHSRATDLARLGFNQPLMNSCLGWAPGSKTSATYIHLSMQDTDDALMRAYGLKKREDKPQALTCPRCGEQNKLTARYCNCGSPMTTSVAMELDEKKQAFDSKVGSFMEMLEDPEVREFLAGKMAKRAGADPASSPV